MTTRTHFHDIAQSTYRPVMALPPIWGMDLFGRIRVSSPNNLLSSQFLFDKQPLFWDELTATNGTSTLNSNHSSVDLAVSGDSGSRVVRQSKEYIVYEPGRSQLVALTGVFGTARTNCNQRLGIFDDDDGCFIRLDGTTFGVGIRSSVSGSVVNTLVAQSSFNLDKLDGTGLSGKTLDVTKSFLFFIEYQWFGVGTVRFGVFIDGIIVYFHQIHHANRDTVPYMKRGALPIRYEIVNAAATAGAVTMKQICCAVSSEAGYNPSGVKRAADTGIVGKVAASGTEIPLISVRLKSTAIRSSIRPISSSVICSTADNFRMRVYLNATLTGASFASVATDSIAEVDTTASALSGGTVLSSLYTSNQVRANLHEQISSLLKIAATIGGVSDIVTLAAIGVPAAGVTLFGALEWHEFF